MESKEEPKFGVFLEVLPLGNTMGSERPGSSRPALFCRGRYQNGRERALLGELVGFTCCSEYRSQGEMLCLTSQSGRTLE